MAIQQADSGLGASELGPLRDAIVERNQAKTLESFLSLVKQGHSVPDLVRSTIDIEGPFIHVPYHQRFDDGMMLFVNNDHTLLGMRVALRLMRYMDSPAANLPLAQAVWYIPSALDIWNQLKGKAPGHYCRQAAPAAEDIVPPQVHFQDGGRGPITTGSFESRLEEMVHAIMAGQVEHSYRLFMGLAAETPRKWEVINQLLFAGCIDMQEDILYRASKTGGHKAFRSRAILELALATGWERAAPIFYAGVPDIAVGPRWHSLYEMGQNLLRQAFGPAALTLKHMNTTPMDPSDIDQMIEILHTADPHTAVNHVTLLLQKGKAVVQIMETIQLAAIELILQAGGPGGFMDPMHVFEYSNAVLFWMRRFEHPHQPKALYIGAHYVNNVAKYQAQYKENGPREFTRPFWANDLTAQELLPHIQSAILSLDGDLAAGLTQSYLDKTAERTPLIECLATAVSRFGNDPHNHELTMCMLEDFTFHSTPYKDRILVGCARMLGGYRKSPTTFACYEAYRELWDPSLPAVPTANSR